ncbi:hypothetical protein RRG08_056300 [Elysia crispata]|uniref:Uncharacterized protein n=1 Tax=Elysia crispata TaxID=231223 RepID=A0AAE1E5Q1_9GAST|nr:hypothetical protein RRG08_056300 [Elysia crispata]
MGSSTARQAVYDVCRAIHKRLGPLELPQQTTESLRETSQDFLRLWKYPHCIGALTRKRIRTKCPCTSSSYRRYKQNRSILLQAVTNTDGMRKEKLDYYNDPALKDIQQRAAQATMSTRYEALGGRSTDHAMYVRDSFANLIANELSCNEVIKQSISDEDQ